MREVGQKPTAFGCINNTIKLRSGSYFDFLDPQPDQFTLDDIAGALSKICRFGGQIDQFYSVAEHSVHCALVAFGDELSIEACQAVMMHDAAEAFTGDMVKPLKVMMPDFKVVEQRVERAIERKFGIDLRAHTDVIREIDHGMLIAERHRLFESPDNVTWTGEDQARKLRVSFNLWSPADAEIAFIALARELGIEELSA